MEAELSRLGFVKVGIQMGLGPTFRRPHGSTLGSVKVKVTRENILEALVSTNSPRIAKIGTILAFFGFVPYLAALGLVWRFSRLINELEFVLLLFGYAVVVIVLGYEYVIGIFPGTRRLQRTLMLTCDLVAGKLGVDSAGKFTLVTKYPQVNRLSALEWRIWKWRPWPDMIAEEEFLKQTS